MKPVLQVGLPKSGICRTISRAVVHSSIKYQGLGVPNPFWMQGIYKIQTLLEPMNTLTQSLIHLSLGNLITESGLGPKVMEYDFHRLKHLVTLGWMTAIWELLNEFKDISIRLVDNDRYKRTPRFPGDQYIMQLLLSNTDISGNDLRLFNICRIYNQVELISDVITADGKNIRRQMWTGHQEQLERDTRFDQLSQPRPTEKAWKLWRHMLQNLLHTNQYGKLNISLPGLQDTHDWKWYYDESCTRLYQRTITGIKELTVHHTGSRQRTRQKKFRIRGDTSTIPPGCRPATAYYTGGSYMIDGLGVTLRQPEVLEMPEAIDEFIVLVIQALRWILVAIISPPLNAVSIAKTTQILQALTLILIFYARFALSPRQ